MTPNTDKLADALTARDAAIQEARQWKMEAQSANATIAEIYRIVGSKAGNWNGANPVREALPDNQTPPSELVNSILAMGCAPHGVINCRQCVSAIAALAANPAPAADHADYVLVPRAEHWRRAVSEIFPIGDKALDGFERRAIELAAAPQPAPAPVQVDDDAEWLSKRDWEKPWGPEAAFLRRLADDKALNTEQAAMLRHCAKRIERTAAVEPQIVDRLRTAARALVKERTVYAEDVETIADVLRLLESMAAPPPAPAADGAGELAAKPSECANGCPAQQVCDYCQKAGGAWRERWEGSGPQKGWHIVESTRLHNNAHVAYLGESPTSEVVTAIVMAHNAAIAALRQPVPDAAWRVPPLDDDSRWILGRPNFTLIGIAQDLRKLGYVIPKKAEEEQAVCIHWMLGMLAKHGKRWRDEAERELAALPIASQQESRNEI